MHFVLVHGWGFHAGIWADVVGHLQGADITLADPVSYTHLTLPTTPYV